MKTQTVELSLLDGARAAVKNTTWTKARDLSTQHAACDKNRQCRPNSRMSVTPLIYPSFGSLPHAVCGRKKWIAHVAIGAACECEFRTGNPENDVSGRGFPGNLAPTVIAIANDAKQQSVRGSYRKAYWVGASASTALRCPLCWAQGCAEVAQYVAKYRHHHGRQDNGR